MNWFYRESCGCRKCLREREKNLPLFERTELRQMILCPICGNKRCPHATDHSYKCTRSNEPGQEGSDYE